MTTNIPYKVKESENKRIIGIALLKCLCCLGVITYHVADDVVCLGKFNFSSVLYYSASFCITMFFVVNGYLIFKKEERTCLYIEEKIKKLVKIIFTWSALMLLIENKYTEISLYSSFIANLKGNGNMPVFWFLGTLIIIYIVFIPILNKLYKTEFFLEIILFIVVFMWMDHYNKSINLPQFLWIHIYLPYFCIGILFARWKNRLLKINKKIIFIMTIIYSIFYMSYILYKNYTVSFSLPANNYSSPFFTIWIIMLFLSFLNVDIKNEKISKIVVFFESNNMGIYAIHLPILIAFTKHYPITNSFQVTVIIVGLFILSATISNILKQIPVLRYLVK